MEKLWERRRARLGPRQGGRELGSLSSAGSGSGSGREPGARKSQTPS